MERSVIRGRPFGLALPVPDYATLHPGYELKRRAERTQRPGRRLLCLIERTEPGRGVRNRDAAQAFHATPGS